ncbi:MAG: Crp/Fnr family transcriptional regulator [DPANN group archaeon]|nr:Crp/Fnr family transcriptional regulator [DPANN group archaeon]
MIFNKKGEKKGTKKEVLPTRPELSHADRLEHGQLMVRSVIEVLGKPEPHVKHTLKTLVGELDKSDSFTIVKKEYSRTKKIGGLHSMFVDVEFWAKNITVLNGFCIDYMPSSIEVLEPEQPRLKAHEIMAFLNDFLAKLHEIDMLAKNLRQQNAVLSNNIVNLYRNVIRLILLDGPKEEQLLARMTGTDPAGISKVLASLKKEGMIQKEGTAWRLHRENKDDKKPDNKKPKGSEESRKEEEKGNAHG